MMSIASREAFGDFTFASFSAKNIPVVLAVMISLSLIESSMFFVPIKTTHLLYRVIIRSKAYYMGRCSRHATTADTSNAFGCSTFTALNAKNILVMISPFTQCFFLQVKLLASLMVMISSSPMPILQSKLSASLIGSSMFPWRSQLLIYCIGLYRSKAYDVFLI